MRINSNQSAKQAFRQYTVNTNAVSKSTEKMSSGYRINRAGDDAAGLAISEKMRAQLLGLTMASKNSYDAISLVQTAEGALQGTQNSLQRMRELAVQSSSDTNMTQTDRAMLNQEFQALIGEIGDTADKTKFNDMGVIDGSYSGEATVNGADAAWLTPGTGLVESGEYTLQSSNQDGVFSLNLKDSQGNVAGSLEMTQEDLQTLDLKVGDEVRLQLNDGTAVRFKAEAVGGMQEGDSIQSLDQLQGMVESAGVLDGSSASIQWESKAFTTQTGANQGDELNLGVAEMSAKGLGVDGLSIADGESARNAISRIDDALNAVSTQRASLGAAQNRFESKINNLDTSAENIAAAESRIRDLDLAKEMTALTTKRILQQASNATLAQANASAKGVLSLLG